MAALLEDVAARAGAVTHDAGQADLVRGSLQKRLDDWYGKRSQVKTGSLGYEEAADVTGLLHAPEEGSWQLWSVPRSLREVEPEIILQVDYEDRSVPDAPAWEHKPAPAAAGGPAGGDRP